MIDKEAMKWKLKTFKMAKTIVKVENLGNPI